MTKQRNRCLECFFLKRGVVIKTVVSNINNTEAFDSGITMQAVGENVKNVTSINYTIICIYRDGTMSICFNNVLSLSHKLVDISATRCSCDIFR